MAKPPRPQQWVPDSTCFWKSRSCGSTGWLALLLINASDVETNPGPTTTQTNLDLRYLKHISIRCHMFERWVHLRCASICQAQYTDTWTCHLHREPRLTTHTDITPPHPSRTGQSLIPTHHLHNRNPNTYTRPILPMFPQDW